MAISRKHFNMVAKELAEVRPNEYYLDKYIQWKVCTHAVAQALAKMNPRFDYDRFIKACNNTTVVEQTKKAA